MSVLWSQNGALHYPQVKRSGQLCVMLRVTACGVGPLGPARHVQPRTALLVSQRLHHRAAVWGRNYRRTARCERSLIYTCSSSGIRSDTKNILLLRHHHATKFSICLWKKTTDHFRCFDEKQKAYFQGQESCVTILPSQLQTDRWLRNNKQRHTFWGGIFMQSVFFGVFFGW